MFPDLKFQAVIGFYTSRAFRCHQLGSIWPQIDPENAILLQVTFLQQGAPSPPSPPFLPFLPLPPLSPFPASSFLACLHACPGGSMEQKRAYMHEACPGLQAGTHPCPRSSGPWCCTTVGAAHCCQPNTQLMALCLIAVFARTIVWKNDDMVHRRVGRAPCSGEGSTAPSCKVRHEREETFPDPQHNFHVQSSVGSYPTMA